MKNRKPNSKLPEFTNTRGVYLIGTERYASKLSYEGRLIHLGTFNTIQEASSARTGCMKLIDTLSKTN